MKNHKFADLFPMFDGAALDALAADIREHGQRDAIVVFDGQILDGRNRWRACGLAGVEPETTTFVGTEAEALAFVVSVNLHRRHLDESQRAMVAARIANMKQGQRTDLAEISARSPTVSQADAAALCSSSRGSVQHAARVLAGPVPELAASVDAGRIPVSVAAKLVDRPEAEQRAIVASVQAGAKPADALRDTKRATVRAGLEDVAAVEAKASAGVYDVIVLDPPWPMEKIERDERPNQVEFDYPTMSEADLAALPVPCANDCHVWVWTTHRFLPMSLRLLDAWGLKYVCAFVWHKPGGFQPIGLPQYNCEFAIYARRGAPTFLDTKALPLCFAAPRGKHSEKPEEFYDVLRRVTAGRRLDMFNRRPIEGFDGWGKEAAHAAAE